MAASSWSGPSQLARGLWRSASFVQRQSFRGLSTSLAVCKTSEPSSRGRGSRQGRRKSRPPLSWAPFKPEQLNVDAPWSSVAQTARPFDPCLIPLPIRMGRAEKGSVPPAARANLELLKIPNFFHLTPPAIEEHCRALKPLCTAWPENLPNLPLRIETRNYILPGRSIYHSGAKKVVLTFKLKSLTLTERAMEKMVHLAGSKYNPDKDTIRIVGKRCPTRKQNYDYAVYVMKVLYLESNRIEPWELTTEHSNTEHDS